MAADSFAAENPYEGTVEQLFAHLEKHPTQVSIKSLTQAFDTAIAHHLKLSPADRAANSKKMEDRVADYVGRTQDGKAKDLLGKNGKLMKSEKGYQGQKPVTLADGRGIETTGLALAPAYQEGDFNTCPNHSSCKLSCLGKTSGNYYKLGGGSDLSKFKGPRLNSLKKTIAMMRDPEAFAVKLHDEIDASKRMAAANGNHQGMRLNILSDIHPRVHASIINAHPDVTFYDYTKNATNPIAPNHHYTYSSTGVSQPAGVNGLEEGEGIENQHQNWQRMRNRLDKGDNVAMAFSHKRHLPDTVHDVETGKKYRVINGDEHDFRPIDEKGVIVGLKNKKTRGKMSEAHLGDVDPDTGQRGPGGFFVHYDPQEKLTAKGTYERGESPGIGPSGKPKLGPTLPQNRTVVIAPQTKSKIVKDNDGKKVEA